MLNPALNPEHLSQAFAGRQRLQIGDFLVTEAADALHACLERDVPWELAYQNGASGASLSKSGFDSMTPDARATLMQFIQTTARDKFQFLYNTYMMVQAYREQRDPQLALHRATEFLNSRSCLDFIEQVTGVGNLKYAKAQATRYLPGHFLKWHDDFQEDAQREIAYVINLTRDWQAHWGGLLQFMDSEGLVIETFTPQFNTLSLFRVPAAHCVSFVAPFATRPRLSITGWFLSN
ncbi:MAG TPA: 2OG-Fe(II) oxygenase family protein [Gammaproteobacteria bacterium]|nr:2OG-Fe(II) oxygenase family protein [Gammaproteobacteria bacterium]